MGKLFGGSSKKKKRNGIDLPGDSVDLTGIAPGEVGSNRGTPRPGRRTADTPLGPGRYRL